MKLILLKHKLSELLRAGVDVDQYVLIPEMTDISELPNGDIGATLTFAKKAIRTIKQNAAIHLFCNLLALALNSAGWTKKKYFEAKTHDDVDWTEISVKEDIWRHIQTALYPDKKSTTQLDKPEVSAVYENINRMTSDNLGVGVDFPNRFHSIKYED